MLGELVNCKNHISKFFHQTGQNRQMSLQGYFLETAIEAAILKGTGQKEGEEEEGCTGKKCKQEC